MPAFDEYYEGELNRRGLKPEGFCPKKGDLFVWHAQLYHGGGRIQNRALSRRSMVNHFWTVEDYREQAVEVRPGKFVLKNQHMFVSPVFVERPQPNGENSEDK
jgi:phytanoyl-CoA hydroxylase